MVRFMHTLKARDVQTHARLQEQDIKPQFFAFRQVFNPHVFDTYSENSPILNTGDLPRCIRS